MIFTASTCGDWINWCWQPVEPVELINHHSHWQPCDIRHDVAHGTIICKSAHLNRQQINWNQKMQATDQRQHKNEKSDGIANSADCDTPAGRWPQTRNYSNYFNLLLVNFTFARSDSTNGRRQIKRRQRKTKPKRKKKKKSADDRRNRPEKRSAPMKSESLGSADLITE